DLRGRPAVVPRRTRRSPTPVYSREDRPRPDGAEPRPHGRPARLHGTRHGRSRTRGRADRPLHEGPAGRRGTRDAGTALTGRPAARPGPRRPGHAAGAVAAAPRRAPPPRARPGPP